MSQRVEHLTRAQKAKLAKELAELEGPRRMEVVQAIKTARSFGDSPRTSSTTRPRTSRRCSSDGSRSCARASRTRS